MALVLALTPSHSAWAQSPASPPPPSSTGTEAARHPVENGELRLSLPEPARADYDVAMMLYDVGDFAGALLKFQLAYDKSKDPRLLWDLLVCENSLRHYARALPLVRRFLTEAATLISPVEREEAENLAKAISNFVGPVRIESDQAGATVLVDDVKVGKTPLTEPVLVDMGDRKITLRKRGYKEATAQVRVLGPSEEHVSLRMERDIPAATLEVVAGAGQWIAVDDGTVGRDRWEGIVSPGKHLIRVSGTGYKPKEVQADLSKGGRVTIWVTAQPLEPSDRSSRWPLVAVLGGATALIAVVAYYGLRPSESRAGTQVLGRLDNVPIGFTAQGWR